MQQNINLFWTQWKKTKIVKALTPNQIYAKMEGNTLLTNKTTLIETMEAYRKNLIPTIKMACNLPETYNLTCCHIMDIDFKKIKSKGNFEDGTWICKPGEYANRGRGIKLFPNLRQAQVFLQKKD